MRLMGRIALVLSRASYAALIGSVDLDESGLDYFTHHSCRYFGIGNPLKASKRSTSSGTCRGSRVFAGVARSGRHGSRASIRDSWADLASDCP